MNREQKTAWFSIIMFGVCFAIYLALVPVVGFTVAPAAFGLFGLTGLSSLIFRRKKSAQGVSCDERDKQIERKATAVGGMASYTFFFLGLLGIWGIQKLAGGSTVDIFVLPVLLGSGCITLFLVRSVVLLVLYHRGNSYAE